MNDMKLIMENWRKFSKHDVLIETKNYNSTLESLVLEYNQKKISTHKFISILEESVLSDLKQLEIINKQINEAAILDKAKQLGQKVSGAVSGAVNAAINKVNEIVLKASMMIYEAPRKAIPLLIKTISFVKNFKNTNPKIYAFLVMTLKILAVAAVAYVALNPGTAHASVEMPKIGGGVRVIDANSPEGKELLGALKALSPENLQGTPLEGLDSGKLKAASDIIQNAVMNKEPQKVQGALKTVLEAAEHLRMQAKNSGEGGTLEKLGAKVVEVANAVAQKSQEAAASGAGTSGGGEIHLSGNTALSKLSSLTNPQNVKSLIKMFGAEKSTQLDAGNMVRKALQVALKSGELTAEEYKSLAGGPAVAGAEEKLRLALQQMAPK